MVEVSFDPAIPISFRHRQTKLIRLDQIKNKKKEKKRKSSETANKSVYKYKHVERDTHKLKVNKKKFDLLENC